tara:strand:- start:2680 stop:2865 length:186 start_codon:yes stop_codon:yes gene_type:complete
MSIEDGAMLFFTATPTSTGSNITTIGVLLRNALRSALMINVARLDSLGRAIHVLAKSVARG